MVGIILASHGEFAKGILQSGTMIIGEQEQVEAVTLMPNEGPNDIREKLQQAAESFDTDEVLFLVDLWGGTPFNQASALFEGHEDTWAIVSGLNLPMLLEALGARFSTDSAHEIARSIVQSAKDAILTKPEDLAPKAEVNTADAQVEPTGALPEGTVVGDGRIDIGLARIDSRLLHGQVATSWSKDVKPTRIIVVSDNVANDELRKNLITQAAPPGIKANVIPIQKMIDVWHDTRFGKTRALLLFENPQDLLEVIKGGVGINEINLGSMAHSEGKFMITNALSVNQEDIDTFKELRDLGATFDVRKVPSDSRADLWKLLKKTKYMD